MSFMRNPNQKDKPPSTNGGGTSRLQPRSTTASRARMTKNVQLSSTCSIPISLRKDLSAKTSASNKPYKPVDQARKNYTRSPSYDELIKSSPKPSSQRQARPLSELSNDSTIKNEVHTSGSEQRFQLKVVLPTSECCFSTGNDTDSNRPNSPNIDNSETCDDDRKMLDAEQLSDAMSLSTASSPTPKQVGNSGCTVKLYNENKEKFHKIKKELDIKQNAALECYVKITNMHQSLLEQGENVEPEMKDLKLLDVGDWAMEELLNLCRGHDNDANTGAGEMCQFEGSGEHVIQDTKSKLNEIPLLFVSFFQEILTNRQGVIDWFKGFLEKKQLMDMEVDTAIEKVMGEGDCLTVKVNEINETLKQTVDSIIDNIKQVCQERTLYIGKNESLLKEKAKLDVVVADMKLFNSNTDKNQQYEELAKELTLERQKCKVTRDRMMQIEGALRTARARAADLERQLKDSDATLATMTVTIKNLELKNRQRETAFDLKARKLHEVNKIGELNVSKLTQQKEALDKKVREQQTEYKSIIEKANKRMQELATELASSAAKLEETTQLFEVEHEARLNAERVAEETMTGTGQLKEKLSELQKICGTRDPNQPSEREMELWTELQNTKACLRVTEEEVIACKRDKLTFLDTLSKIAESDNKLSVHQKLAADLLAKEETIAKLQTQVHEYTKNLKLTEQKLVQYELQNQKLQQNIIVLQESKGDIQPISYQELQQEIMNLRMNLVESVHRNEELSEIIIQKDITLEQQEKTSKSTSKVLKTREELITLLRNKEIEQSKSLKLTQSDLENRGKTVEEFSKQIAQKSSEIQQLFVTLDGKQLQIHKLEAIVLALEEQHRRGQAQRTRHEEKIAILEHELAELKISKKCKNSYNYPISTKDWCTVKKRSLSQQNSLHRPDFPLEVTQFDFVKMLKLAEKCEKNNEVRNVDSLKTVRSSSSKQQSLNEVNCKRPISGKNAAGSAASKNTKFPKPRTFKSLYNSTRNARVARVPTAASNSMLPPVAQQLVTVLDSQMENAKEEQDVQGAEGYCILELKRLYADKKRQFEELQSELLEKQKQAVELHTSMKQMREQLKEAKIQEIKAQCCSEKKAVDNIESPDVFAAAQNVDKMIIDSFMRMMQSTRDEVSCS